jgi:hypothetical protein
MRRAGLAVCTALGGTTVEGVVDMMSICAYALFALKKTARGAGLRYCYKRLFRLNPA